MLLQLCPPRISRKRRRKCISQPWGKNTLKLKKRKAWLQPRWEWLYTRNTLSVQYSDWNSGQALFQSLDLGSNIILFLYSSWLYFKTMKNKFLIGAQSVSVINVYNKEKYSKRDFDELLGWLLTMVSCNILKIGLYLWYHSVLGVDKQLLQLWSTCQWSVLRTLSSIGESQFSSRPLWQWSSGAKTSIVWSGVGSQNTWSIWSSHGNQCWWSKYCWILSQVGILWESSCRHSRVATTHGSAHLDVVICTL